jgi:hypothetical protein
MCPLRQVWLIYITNHCLYYSQTCLKGHIYVTNHCLYYKYCLKLMNFNINQIRGHRGRNRMVVGFTTTYVISAHHQVSIISVVTWENLVYMFCLMLFNATFNNISNISWWAVLLVEEIGENHRPVASHWQTLSHNDKRSLVELIH